MVDHKYEAYMFINGVNNLKAERKARMQIAIKGADTADNDIDYVKTNIENVELETAEMKQ